VADDTIIPNGTSVMLDDEQLSRAAGALVDESAVEMTTDDGGVLEVWTIASHGSVVRASAPRLAVRVGMTLTCRLVVEELPHRISALVEAAEVQSQARATLSLRVVAVTVDGQRRRSARIQASVPASLTALVCDRMVPGETIAAVIDDISIGGVALSVADTRARSGDRLRLRARVLEGVIDCELRVTSARPGGTPGTQVIGGPFIAAGAPAAAAVADLIGRLDGSRPAALAPDIRTSLGLGAPDAASASTERRALDLTNRGLASA
jgi:hypothetical protein